MAKNWTISEAVAAIKTNDADAIQDLGKRYPLLLHKVTLALAKAPQEVEELMAIMPDYVTANKLNKELIEQVDSAEDNGKKTAKAAKVEDADDSDDEDDVQDDEDDSDDSDNSNAPFDENMSSKEMYALCGQLGIKKQLKDTKKPTMIAALKKYYAENGAADADSDDEDANENPYEGKKAIDLYNECKNRGINVKPKQKAAYYIDLLLKDDNNDSDDDDDEWEDDSNDTKKEPPKKQQPAKKATVKKFPKKSEPKKDEDDAENDDDEWEI